MTSLQSTAGKSVPGERGTSPSVGPSENGARSLGAELMELFVRKQADEVSSVSRPRLVAVKRAKFLAQILRMNLIIPSHHLFYFFYSSFLKCISFEKCCCSLLLSSLSMTLMRNGMPVSIQGTISGS